MKLKLVFACAVFVIASVIAVPATAGDNGWYIGISSGASSTGANVSSFDDGGITSGEVDDPSVGWKIFGGYRIIKFLAVEGGYADLDEVTFDGVSDGSGILYAPGAVSSVFDVNGSFVNVVGILPIAPGFAIIGKVGFLNWNGDFSLEDTVQAIKASDDGVDPVYTFGLEFLPNSKFTVRAEFEKFTGVFDEDVDRVSASLLVRF